MKVKSNSMEKEIQDYPGKWYQPLFDLMYNQHGLILLGSEMDEVISVVKEMVEEKEALNPSSDSKRAKNSDDTVILDCKTEPYKY